MALVPWWVNVVPAALVCLSFKYLIPSSISFHNHLYKAMAKALSGLASLAGGVFLLIAAIEDNHRSNPWAPAPEFWRRHLNMERYIAGGKS